MHKQNTDQIIPFSFHGNNIRAIMLHGEPWFVAKDVAEVLGYVNASDAISKHCKGVAKRYPLRTAGGVQEIRIIAEPDLYRLIAHSRLPAAVEFEAWIFEEVLPTLRKTGRYTMPELDPEEAYNRVGANRADIFHHRGPTSKSGLDIRYTMDLTKIALNPNPRTLDLVQRLTGVDMSDLVEEMDSRLASSSRPPHAGAWIEICDFVQDCLTVMPGSRLRCTKLYAVFKRWYARVQEPGADEFRARIPSMRTLNTALRKRGYRIEKAGVYYVLDVAIPGSCPYRWDDSDEIEQRDPSTLRPSFAR